MKILKSITLVALISVLGIGCKSEKSGKYYLLRLNPEIGQNHQMSMALDMGMETMGISTKMDMMMNMDMKALSKSEAGIDMEVTYGRVMISMDIPAMGKIEYDTDKPDSNGGIVTDIYSGMFGKLIGRPHTMGFNNLGKITDFSSLEDLFAGLKTESTGSQADFGQFYDNMLAIFPEDSIRIGDTWDGNTTTRSQMPFNIKYTYTLKSVESEVATLSFKGTLELNKEKANIEGANFKKMEGTIEGETKVNVVTGLTVAADIHQTMNMEVETFGMSMPMKIKNHITITSK